MKRVLIVIAPIAGGPLILSLGVVKGIHVALLITLVLALRRTQLLALRGRFAFDVPNHAALR